MDVIFIMFLFLVSVSFKCDRVLALNRSFSSVLVFGDSTVDPGNNNFILTTSKADFDPYGIDLQGGVQKGRFSNGKLATDFVAFFLGLKDLIPPYLDKSLSMEELATGVSFASAATGYDPFTPRILNVISMQKELRLFKEYKERLEGIMETDRVKNHIENALFIVSCGSNDFFLNYFSLPIRPKQFTVIEFQNFLIEKARSFFQGLIDLGARKILIFGAGPVGCLPGIITLKSNTSNELSRHCIEEFNDAARQFNQKLQDEIQVMQNNYPGSGIVMVYVDILEPLLEIIENFKSHGFEWNRGCCGTDFMELSVLCNRRSRVCHNRSEFVFFDSYHPTERVYYLLFLRIRDIIINTFF